MVFALCMPAFAYKSTEYVVDQSGTLTDAQRMRLESRLAELDASTGYHFRLYILDESVSGRYVGEEYLDDYGFYHSDDLLLLIVSRYRGVWYYDLYAYGACDARLSDYEVNALLDDPAVYDSIKSADIYTGASALFSASEGLLQNRQMKGDVPLGERIGPAFLIAILVSSLCVGIVVLLYKRKRRGATYPLDEFTDLKLTLSSDLYVGSSVSRRYVPRSSSSSGGSSGGGGRGGGAGHRGGR